MHNLLSSPSLISMFVLGSGNVIGTLISALTLIIFSRMLGPEQFGLFSAAFALMQIVIKLIDSGTTTATERALAKAHSDNQRAIQSIMSTAVYLKIILYLLWAALGYIFAEPLAKTYLNLSDAFLIKQAILLSFGTVIFEYSTAVFQSAGNFALVARITLAQAMAKLIGGILLITQSALTATTALWLYGLMPALGSLAGWVSSQNKFTLKLSNAWQRDAKAIITVAKWTGIATIAATLADNLDTLMVQSMLSLHDTGVWSAAARIAAFANLIPWTIGSVLSIRVTRFKENKHLRAYLKKARIIGLGSAGLIMLGIPLSSLAIYLTVGPAYSGGTMSLMLMLFASALSALTAPLAALYYLFDKPQYYAYAGLISTILLVGLDYVLIPLYGLHGAGVTRIIARGCVLIFTLFYTRRVIHNLSNT